ncbi:MAG: hypothetical protein J4473_03655 [Candidatus Aenigmarchaeota archaeon]|nr:hypothetical protein [Candidatus Aenigmarchaeota archaeon]
MEIVSEELVSVPEAKEIMVKRSKERELVYEQNICSEFLNKIVRLSSDKANHMAEELKSIIILKPRYIILIIDMMPDTEEEVEVLFSKERTNLKKEEINQIINIVKKYK